MPLDQLDDCWVLESKSSFRLRDLAILLSKFAPEVHRVLLREQPMPIDDIVRSVSDESRNTLLVVNEGGLLNPKQNKEGIAFRPTFPWDEMERTKILFASCKAPQLDLILQYAGALDKRSHIAPWQAGEVIADSHLTKIREYLEGIYQPQPVDS